MKSVNILSTLAAATLCLAPTACSMDTGESAIGADGETLVVNPAEEDDECIAPFRAEMIEDDFGMRLTWTDACKQSEVTLYLQDPDQPSYQYRDLMYLKGEAIFEQEGYYAEAVARSAPEDVNRGHLVVELLLDGHQVAQIEADYLRHEMEEGVDDVPRAHEVDGKLMWLR